MKIHHARSHGEKLQSEVVCEQCGGEFEVYECHEDGSRFCSMDCKSEYQSENLTGNDHPNWHEGATQVCEHCGDKYRPQPSYMDDSSYCSRVCMSKAYETRFSGENSNLWSGGPDRNECEYCGDLYEVAQKAASTSRFCSVDCLAGWQSENWNGARSPSWRGGKSVYDAVKRSLSSWPRARSRAVADECRICGSEDNLHVHHIIPVMAGGTNEQWNLITLCECCHGTVESRTREFTEPILVE